MIMWNSSQSGPFFMTPGALNHTVMPAIIRTVPEPKICQIVNDASEWQTLCANNNADNDCRIIS